jgi:hypothetical protein
MRAARMAMRIGAAGFESARATAEVSAGAVELTTTSDELPSDSVLVSVRTGGSGDAAALAAGTLSSISVVELGPVVERVVVELVPVSVQGAATASPQRSTIRSTAKTDQKVH